MYFFFVFIYLVFSSHYSILPDLILYGLTPVLSLTTDRPQWEFVLHCYFLYFYPRYVYETTINFILKAPRLKGYSIVNHR